MRFFENTQTYEYPFPAVSLAYFLRYPNPLARHVLTTDVIDRYVDQNTHRLHTTRLHLKRTAIPSSIIKLLPKRMGGSEHFSQAYILERTVVDPAEGWMETESRNMEWTSIISVIERQRYQRLVASGNGHAFDGLTMDQRNEQTIVCTNVTLRSRLGQQKSISRRKNADVEEEEGKRSFFSSLSTAGVQRTIELIGLKRTRDAVSKGKQGMDIVLERLRRGGIACFLEGMHEDRANGPYF
ncbi:hypothetical protein N7454_005230 [Penicillium verhagenii]|nr:hypothetical protein N7454_005230 [Penicillium verhagenii]